MRGLNVNEICASLDSIALTEGTLACIGIAPTEGAASRFHGTILNHLRELRKLLDESGLRECIEPIDLQIISMERDTAHTFDGLRIRTENIRDVVHRELFKHWFLLVPGEYAERVDRPGQFGKKVLESFPSADRDILEAANCIAADCNTAAVFHLVRAAEIALRALANDRGVEYPNSAITQKQCGDLITALDSKLKDLRAANKKLWPSESLKNEQIRFYHSALMEFRSINEAWRKQVCHSKPDSFYDEDFAISVYNHVRGLMIILAEKITEFSKTPEYWTEE